MVFRLLFCRADMPGMKVSYDDLVAAKEGLRLDRSKLCNVLLFLCSPTLEMRVLRSNQGLNRAYDITQLPVTCLDMHARTT